MTSMQDVCLPWARRGPRTRGGRGAGAHGESVIQSTAAPLTATLEPLTAAGVGAGERTPRCCGEKATPGARFPSPRRSGVTHAPAPSGARPALAGGGGRL